jgi:hypothetical protein
VFLPSGSLKILFQGLLNPGWWPFEYKAFVAFFFPVGFPLLPLHWHFAGFGISIALLSDHVSIILRFLLN